MFTHSNPSIKGVSAQSISGNLCKILPVLVPLPNKENNIKNMKINKK